MRVAIVHYHLRAGGVTRVIQHSVRALRARSVDVAVLSGAAPESSWPCPVSVVTGVNYSSGEMVTERAVMRLVERLKRSATRALGQSPDIWHIHNHALGRNPALTMAAHHLAAAGERLLLQIHDFAEDGRPYFYRRLLNHLAKGDLDLFGALAYPQAPQVHYAVLNQRDERFLHAAGMKPALIHGLPNPIILPPDNDSAATVKWEGKRRFLYPTRALRRKNIGEILFWAAAGKPHDSFALTLAPTSETDRVVYDAWKKYARRWRLRVQFEVGLNSKASLVSWMRSATAIITTSVAEGFGLAFLEPWLCGTPVVGRNLLEITPEFRAAGVRLRGLYNRLAVPLSWIGADKFRRALYQGLRQSYRAYGRSLTSMDLERAYSAAVWKNKVDFGRLNEPLQLAVIDRVRCSSRLRSRIRPLNLETELKVADVAYNAGIIKKAYGLEQYGARLLGVYRRVLKSPERPPWPAVASERRGLAGLPAGRLLEQFLDPDRFYLLRT